MHLAPLFLSLLPTLGAPQEAPAPGEPHEQVVQDWGAYWLRVVADSDVHATAQLELR